MKYTEFVSTVRKMFQKAAENTVAEVKIAHDMCERDQLDGVATDINAEKYQTFQLDPSTVALTVNALETALERINSQFLTMLIDAEKHMKSFADKELNR